MTLLFGFAAVAFGVFTTYQHVIALGLPYLAEDGTQMQRHLAQVAEAGGNPVQYRVLSMWLLDLLFSGLQRLGVRSWATAGFIGLRVLEDVAIFLFAFGYYRALGLSAVHSLIGLSLLAWGMSYGHHNCDLRFDTFLEVSFYLLAALCILHERYALVIPIVLVAALNRETSGLIPVMLFTHFAYRSWSRGRRLALTPREWGVVGAAFAVYALVFVVLRLAFPSQPLLVPYGNHQGVELLLYNVLRITTWIQLLATLGIVPLLALLGFRSWPQSLRAFGWAIVPVWLLVHLFGAVLAEGRLLLVPQAMVFVPGAMFLAQSDRQTAAAQ